MKRNKLLSVFIAGLFLVGITGSALAMTTTAYDNAANMAAAIAGSGITISNAAYTGAGAASGYFSGGAAAGIGIKSGIVLTSGYASNLDGTSNTSDGITGNNGLGGAAMLDQLIPGYTTYDATILSFDFQFTNGLGGDAFFNFVFGSDEYNEFVGSSFNDVFGFFLDGTAIADNVALIPGTSTPVAINTVNNTSNGAYYNDNDPSNGTPTPYAFEYDGFTDVFNVSMLGLDSGVHHIDLAIADAGDHVLDSGVFIQGSSFGDVIIDPGGDTGGEPVPEPGTMLLLGTGLAGLFGVRRKAKKV